MNKKDILRLIFLSLLFAIFTWMATFNLNFLLGCFSGYILSVIIFTTVGKIVYKKAMKRMEELEKAERQVKDF